MAAQPPPYAYPVDPSTGYPAPQQQPGYPAAAQAGYPAQGYAPTDVKPGGVDAYGQPVPGYPQQPPGYQPYPTQAAPPTGYSAQQHAATTVSSP